MAKILIQSGEMSLTADCIFQRSWKPFPISHTFTVWIWCHFLLGGGILWTLSLNWVACDAGWNEAMWLLMTGDIISSWFFWGKCSWNTAVMLWENPSSHKKSISAQADMWISGLLMIKPPANKSLPTFEGSQLRSQTSQNRNTTPLCSFQTPESQNTWA